MDFLPPPIPETSWEMPKISALPSWQDARRVAVDLETRDPKLTKLGPGVRRGAEIVGVGFAIEDGPAAYLPIRHAQGRNLDPELVLRYLADQAEVFTGDIVGANLQYDLDFLAEERVVFRRAAWFRDVQVAAPLVNELEMSYSLDSIAKRLGLPGKDESHLAKAARAWGVDPKKGMYQLPGEHVARYGEQDCRLPLEALRRLERDIVDQGIERVYDIESRLLPVLLKMRRRGVRIDHDKIDQVEAEALRRERDAWAEVHRLTGFRLTEKETNKAAAIAPILEGPVGVKLPRTSQDKPSVTKAILAAIDHPVASLVRDARKWNKVRTTFCKSRREHAVRGRIHPTFNQLRGQKAGNDYGGGGGEESGARYGRLSSSDPNLQQEPGNDPEIGPLWRSIYLPDEGAEWACLDYSQQEPRWAVHFAEEVHYGRKKRRPNSPTGFESALVAGDRYRNDPSTDFHLMMSEIIGWGPPGRKRSKSIGLGLMYGMGEAKLCDSIGVPTELREIRGRMRRVAGPEGREILDTFDKKVGFLRALARAATAKADKYGVVRTISGRKCRFPKRIDGRGWDWCHKALNRVVQGSSGDQTKIAMIEADAADIRLQLQVHDELDLSVWDRRTVRDLAEIMRECVPCRVPAKIDPEVGPSWGEIKEIEV